jgi:predicted nucleic acid-binding protein
MRVFLDANVLFSASNAESNIARLIARLIAWLGERETVVTSDLAVEEARKNLQLKRTAWLSTFEALLREVETVPAVLFPLPVSIADKDAPLLCAAIRSGCQFFVTGDKRDFGHLYNQQVQGVEVVSLLRLAAILAGAR